MNGEYGCIGDEELLDYVVEKDFEDTVGKIILNTVEEAGVIGKCKLAHLLRGRNPHLFRSSENLHPFFGRLRMLSVDEIIDFEESAIRLGYLGTEKSGRSVKITEKGEKARFTRRPLGMMIPWPLPSKTFPENKSFYNCRMKR